MTNKGNGTAYNCIATITSPADCLLNSNTLISSTKIGESNFYEIECGNEISKSSISKIILTYNPAEITPSCLIRGTISYKDGTGKSLETRITDFYVQPPTTTTIPPISGGQKRNVLYIIVIVLVVVIIVVLLLYKYRRKDVENSIKRIEETIKRIKELRSKISHMPKT